MQTIRLSILINAAAKTVWDALLNLINSRKRLPDFSPVVLKEGTCVLKQTPAGDDVLCRVARFIPGKLISIEQEVILNDDKLDYWHPESKNWMGLYEIYRLGEDDNGQVSLCVEVDSCWQYTDWNHDYCRKILADVKLRSEQIAAMLMSN